MKKIFALLLSILPIAGLAEEKPATTQQQAPAWLQQQSRILNAIGQEVVSGIPDNWTTATLTIESDGRSISYSLKNSKNEEGKASISKTLAQLCEDLYVNYAQNQEAWSKAVLSYDLTPEGKWKFKTNVSYPK